MTPQAPQELHERTAGPSQTGVALFRQYAGSSLPPSLVGRFTKIKWLGEGGMGVLFSAHDPTLDRKVAIKVLRPSGDYAGERSARLLREGQALAKLTHPNVVRIHDAQQDGHEVWLSMEYVDGVTLNVWLAASRRTWREVLRVIVCVARGLAAAHEAGLVHSDVKPSNVMIDQSGRVLVMDFGLVRSNADELATMDEDSLSKTAEGVPTSAQSSEPMTAPGTPAYMAPEQWAIKGTDGRTDQFSLCVLLWEALYRARPFAGTLRQEISANVRGGIMQPPPRYPGVPPWLHRVMLRGLSVDMDARFPLMQELADALEHGNARMRNRRLRFSLVGVAAAAAITAGVYRYDYARRVAACEGAGTEINAVWNDDVRAKLQRSILATGVSYAEATAEKLPPWFDQQAAQWSAARTEACMNVDVQGRWDVATSDRALWCLEDRRIEVEVLLAELSRANATSAQKAVAAAANLQSSGACVDDDWLRRRPAPPDEKREHVLQLRHDLARAASLHLAGHSAEALEVAIDTRKRAQEQVEWPPIVVAAQHLEGYLLRENGDYKLSEQVSAEAYFAAANAGVWEVAALTANDLAYTVSERLARPADGRAWLRHTEVATTYAGDPGGLHESNRLSRLALIEYAEDSFDVARTHFTRALVLSEAALGPHHPDIAAILTNLANVYRSTGNYLDAIAMHTRALAIRENAQGFDHPDVAGVLTNLANVHRYTGALTEALALQTRALKIRERTVGPDHPEVAAILNNIAVVHAAMGAHSEARAYNTRALAIKEKSLGPDHPDVATSLNNLASSYADMGQYTEVLPLLERAAAIELKTWGPDHLNVALSLSNLALVHTALGSPEKAREMFERALAIREQRLGPRHPDVAYSLVGLAETYMTEKRPQAALLPLLRAVEIYDADAGMQEGEVDANFDLAKVLEAAHGDQARAVAEAEKARAGFIAAGPGRARDLAEVEAWLAKYRGAK